jgi:hypothetical protein
MSPPTTITQLIEGSGNNFHAKVARWFSSNGWHTVVSPYYMDQSQAKARELDLVVEKLWPIRNFFNEPQGDVVIRLFVECKFVPTEAVFWFAPKNRDSAKKLVCALGPFRENNMYADKHHYLASCPRVAKLFASNNTRAQENEPFFKALNQALNATVSLRGRSPAHPNLVGRRSGISITLNYPVIVCSSFRQLYEVDFYSESEPHQISSNFQLEVQYAYHDPNGRERDEYFLLDFVEFDQLNAFEALLADGASSAACLAALNSEF